MRSRGIRIKRRAFICKVTCSVMSERFAKEFKGRRQSPKKISDKTAFPYNPRTDLKTNLKVV